MTWGGGGAREKAEEREREKEEWRKWAAGRTDVCGHSLHRLLARKAGKQ